MNTFVLPPLPLLVLIAAGLVLLPRRRRLGLALAWTGVGLTTLLSLPLVGGFLLFSLQGWPALDLDAPPPAEAIVVLGADQEVHAPDYGDATVGALTLVRLRYAAHLARRTGVPLVTSGGQLAEITRPLGELMADCLREDFGVDVRWVEARSGNTLGNARATAALLGEVGVKRVYLVTHAWHMPRARASFLAQGLEVVPAPTGFRVRPRPDPGDFVPSAKGLRESTFALYEWLGRAWYELRYL